MSELVDVGDLHPALRGLRRPATSRSPGLSRALGAHLGVDSLLVRVAFLIFTPVGGLGWLAYLWGVLLVPRQGKEPPLKRFVPRFATWSKRSQWLAIALGSIAMAALISHGARTSVIPALALAALLFMRSSRRPALTTAEDDLPVVDLYGPETVDELPPQPDQSPAKATWLGALAIGGLGLAVGVATHLLVSRSAIVVGSAFLGAIGIAMVLWALTIRERRLPLTFLVAALMAALMLANLATAKVTAPTNPTEVPGDATSASYEIVAESATIDLRHLTSNAVVNVNATASEVRLLLPAAPSTKLVWEILADVSVPSDTRSEPPATGPELRIRAIVSSVVVEYPT